MIPVMGHADDAYDSWRKFSALNAFVETNYRLDETIGTFDVYRRRTQ